MKFGLIPCNGKCEECPYDDICVCTMCDDDCSDCSFLVGDDEASSGCTSRCDECPDCDTCDKSKK